MNRLKKLRPSARTAARVLLGSLVALLLLAASSQPAQAQIPLIAGGAAALGLFGGGADKVLGAAGDIVLKGVQAVLDWIYGGLQDTITPFVMKFLTRVDLVFDDGMERMVAPLVVIGAALMVLGAVTSIIHGYAAVIAGTASSASVISGALMRVAGLALLMGSWHTLVPIAVDVANEFSAYVLTDQAVKEALAKTFAIGGGASAGVAASGVAPIVLVIMLTLLAICFICLLLLKYIVMFAFAVLYLGGPVMIGVGAFPGLGSVALNALVRSLGILMLIPLAWATVFAAWAAVNSAVVTDPPKEAGAYALAVINGPGLFVASCLVVLGVTRALVKMATPLGAPLNIPGARMAMAAAAYKVAPAVMAAQAGVDSAGLAGAEAVAAHNSRYEGTPYQRAVAASDAWDAPGVGKGMDLAAAGGGTASAGGAEVGDDRTDTRPEDAPGAPKHESGADVIDGTAREIESDRRAGTPPVEALPPGAPDFDAARARIAELHPANPAQVASALDRLDEDEREYVRDAAESARALQQAAGGEEGNVHFREQIAAGMADGQTFRADSQEHAAVIGAGSHQDALDALNSQPPNPADIDKTGYTERELQRDWTEPVQDDDEAGR